MPLSGDLYKGPLRYNDGEIAAAYTELVATLGHFKDGTRPGDDKITEGHVVSAIQTLIEANVRRALALQAGAK